EGIEHQTSTSRTPELNGVVERPNRTLVEAARTMLSASKLPLFFWAEAITTACYTQNRSIIILTHDKTAYHIINDRKTLIKHLHIFGCIFYITRDGENLYKMKEKGDPCILVGYSTQSKGYRVYNKRTRLIDVSIYIRFDDIKEMSETSVANDTSGLVLQRKKASDYDNFDPVPQLQYVSSLADEHVPSQQELDLLFGPLYDEFFTTGTSSVNKSSSPTNNSNQQDTQPTMNIQPTSAPSTTTYVHAEQNNDNQVEEEHLQEDKFTNPFCTVVQEVTESSLHNIESLDSDSESEDAEEEGTTTEDEGPALWNEGLAVGDEGLNMRVKSLSLGVDEVVLEGQQRATPFMKTSVGAPLGLGYRALRRHEIASREGQMPSVFEVGQGSGFVPEPERTKRVSTLRQPTLTTWIDLEDGKAYIDVPAYPPPAPPIQTPPSLEWSSGLLLVSSAPSTVPLPISPPMNIPLTVPSTVASPATAEAEVFLNELGAQVEMQVGLIHDHTVRLGELSPALFKRYDRDIGELFARSRESNMPPDSYSAASQFRGVTDWYQSQGYRELDTIMSNSEDSTVTYTTVSSPYEGRSRDVSPGVDGPPVKPEDPYAYVVAAFQALPPPDYVSGPEEPEQEPPLPVYIPYVPEPVYPEYIPPKDDVFPIEEQPLPATTSPTTDSPRYILESDPDEDPEDDDEDPEEDPADYPADHDDEKEDEEPSGDDPPTLFFTKKEAKRFLAMPIPPPLPLNRPKVTLPPQKRLSIVHCPGYEAGESSAAVAARPMEGRRVDYRFVDSVEAEIKRRRAEDIGYGIRDTWMDPRDVAEEEALTTLEGVNTRVTELTAVQEQGTQDIYGVMEDTQGRQTEIFQRVEAFVNDSQYHYETGRLVDQEARCSREA
nr:hypothetical protein [Tanacetum cinerariifolium]